MHQNRRGGEEENGEKTRRGTMNTKKINVSKQ
jgi:hypothetical protein